MQQLVGFHFLQKHFLHLVLQRHGLWKKNFIQHRYSKYQLQKNFQEHPFLMSDENNIQYLQHHEINKTKWDESISNASNGLIYGYSYYLDNMSNRWDALVMGEYEAVMPLTWNKKYGIAYLYQPFFTACLGVFGNNIHAFHQYATFVNNNRKHFPRLLQIFIITGNHHH